MPFTRITLLKGKSPEELRAISDSLDRAMVESFDVPEKDRFQVFHQVEPGELIFDPDYRGGPRSSGFIHFHITTGKTRPLATKQNFYRNLVDKLSQTAGIRPEDVMIVVANSTFEDWSFASGICAAIPSEVPA